MNSRQEAKLTMYRAVEQHCDNHESIIETIVALKNAFTKFKATIAEIIEITQLTDVTTSGFTVDKTKQKESLAQKTADLAGLIFAFATNSGNEPLKEETNIKLSKLVGTRDDQLAPRCQKIHDKGRENLTALKHYGVEEIQLTELQTEINNYLLSTPKPRLALSERKIQNANLRRLIDEADRLLKDQMDRLVVNFRNSNPNFLAGYESNRIIIEPSRIATQLKGIVSNKADGKPIKNAKLTIVERELQALTNSAGEYSIKPAPQGTFTIKTTASGFQDFELDEVVIKKGQVKTLNVALSLTPSS